MFKFASTSLIALAAVSSVPALAQSSDGAPDKGFTGIYIGGSVGAAVQQNDFGSQILFDTHHDGQFGDTVQRGDGSNDFAPGFCGGAAKSATPGACTKDKDGVEYLGRIGFDIQHGPIVFGIVGEGGRSEINDSVSAYSLAPNYYTMTRSLRYNGSVRGRIGFTPNNTTLFYGTGGGAYGRVRSNFTTSNQLNNFTTNGDQDAWGYSAGGGVEQKLGKHFSIGMEYLYTDLKDNKARVEAGPGTAAASNPFLLTDTSGTTLRRGDEHFRWHAIRAVATFRF